MKIRLLLLLCALLVTAVVSLLVDNACLSYDLKTAQSIVAAHDHQLAVNLQRELKTPTTTLRSNVAAVK